MSFSPVCDDLLDILACPACDERPNVELKDNKLFCPNCGRLYPIVNGIPLMIVEKAEKGEGKKGD